MRIDSTHKPWMIVTLAAIAVGVLVYVPYAIHTPEPGGGTPIGLMFGSIALGLMLFAALLSVRKRFPIWRIGRTKIWMRAHLWLGFLALPMVLFHSAFHARGALTTVLMWLTIIVVVRVLRAHGCSTRCQRRSSARCRLRPSTTRFRSYAGSLPRRPRIAPSM